MWVTETETGKYKFIERYTCPLTGKYKYVSTTLATNSRQSWNKAQQTLNKRIEEKTNAKPPEYLTATFHELSGRWLNMKDNGKLKQSTIRNYENNIKKINEKIGHIETDSLTSVIVNRYLLEELEAGLSNKVVKERRKLLRNIIKFGCRQGYIEEDFSEELHVEDMNLSEKEDEKFLEPKEAEELFTKLTDDGYEDYANFFRLQMYTGARFGEIAALHLPEINLVEKTLTIKYTYDRVNALFTSPKNGKERVLHINDTTVSLIKKILHRRNLLKVAYGVRDTNLLFFRKDGTPLDPGDANRVLHKFEKDKKMTTHIFRHTFITRMVENKVPSKLIAEYVGHADTELIERVYSHFSSKMDSDLKEAINSINL